VAAMSTKKQNTIHAPVSERKKTVVMPALGVCSGCHFAKLAGVSFSEAHHA